MRVLHVIDSGGFYGAEAVLLDLMRAQKQLGIIPILASIGTPDIGRKPIEVRAIEAGLDVRPLRMKAGLNLTGARSLFRLASVEKVDLLHSHGYKGNILLGLLPLWWRKVPLVTTLHGWTRTGKLNRMMLYEWLDSVSLKCVDHVVFVNQLMGDHPRLKNLSRLKTSAIDNGIDIQALAEKQKLAAPDQITDFAGKRFTIVAVGRFSPEKGFSLLIDVVAELVQNGCDLQLLLLGEGRLRSDFAQQAANLNLSDRVLMPGYVDNVPACLAICQLFAMPSLTEGLPMALIEAMSAGIPIVASRVGGIPDALQGGECGRLISAGAREELLEAICEAYRSLDEFSRLAESAKSRVEDKFSAATMAERYAQIYQSVQSREAAA